MASVDTGASISESLEKTNSVKDFISFTCKNSTDENLGIELKTKFDSISSSNIDSFLDAFKKWTKNKDTIAEKQKLFNPKWMLNECSITYPASNKYYKEWEIQNHTINGSSVAFLPTSHFQGLTSAQINESMKLMDEIPIENKSLLLEGFEFQEQIPCEQVLQYALKDKYTLKSSEQTFMLHNAFWKGNPIIGADNQRLQENDFIKVGPEVKTKVIFLKTHQILGRLVSVETNGTLSGEKLDLFIERALRLSKLPMKVSEYKNFYKKLNQRDVPNTAYKIMMDLAPASFQNLGTNRLTDSLLDPLRNQALLNAIEFANSYFGSSIIVYGAAHYGIVRDELISFSNKPIKVDYCRK